jgi:hypothetical protein
MTGLGAPASRSPGADQRERFGILHSCTCFSSPPSTTSSAVLSPSRSQKIMEVPEEIAYAIRESEAKIILPMLLPWLARDGGRRCGRWADGIVLFAGPSVLFI